MTTYDFITIWKVDAPIEKVFDALLHSEKYPTWWRAVTDVQEIAPGQPDGLGNERRYTWRTSLPYGLMFNLRAVRVEFPTTLEATATGELVGRGLWRLRQDGGTTIVRYDWNVQTTKRWMNALAPILRPLFEYNHDIVMRWGAEGLAKLLNTKVESLKGEPLRVAAQTMAAN